MNACHEAVPSLGSYVATTHCLCKGPILGHPTTSNDQPLSGRILVDMDNTLNDWDAQFMRVMKSLYPSFVFLPPERRRHYSMEKNYSAEVQTNIADLVHLRGFWSTMPSAPGAVQAMNEMRDSGLDVWIVSAPDPILTGKCAREKYEWVETHLGPDWKKRLILTQDKTMIIGDILIDDKPTASEGQLAGRQSWVHVAYCHPYNQGDLCPQAVARLHHWADWRDVLSRVLLKTSTP